MVRVRMRGFFAWVRRAVFSRSCGRAVVVACLFAGAAALGASADRIDRADNLARIHLEALGGRERVEALKAVRATGHVVSNGKRVDFYMIAARPAKLRLEIDAGGRTQVQGYNGEDEPWEFDTGTWPPRYVAMPAGAARTFASDAEFDDPLVAGAARGYTLEYAGEVEGEGGKFLRILVTRNLTETYSLLLDPQTFLIAVRVENRMTVAGRPYQVLTRFEDYRPVDGVLLAHRVTVVTDGRVLHQSVIESIQANPEYSKGTFSRPKNAAR